MKKYFYLSTLVFFVACSATKLLPPSQTDVNRGADNFSGLTLTQLTDGEQVYQQNCNKCHPFKKPSSRTALEWKEIIPDMTEKTNRKFGKLIDTDKQESLLRYVSIMCSASAK